MIHPFICNAHNFFDNILILHMLSCFIQVSAASNSLCLKLHVHMNYCLKIWLPDLSKYWSTSGQKESLGITKSNLQSQGKAILKIRINSKLLLEAGPDVCHFSVFITLLWFTWPFEKKSPREQPSSDIDQIQYRWIWSHFFNVL